MSEEEAVAAPEPVEEVEMSVLDALKDVSQILFHCGEFLFVTHYRTKG
jgi:hypothetical protein